MELIGILNVKVIIDVIVFVLVVSCLNLVLYIVLWMLFLLFWCKDVLVFLYCIDLIGMLCVVVFVLIVFGFLIVIVNYLMLE